MKNIYLFLLLSFIIISNLNSYSFAEEDGNLVSLDINDDVYFVSDHYTGGSCLLLTNEGKYFEYAKEHMGVFQTDEGDWSKSEDTKILLISRKRYHNINSGGLSVFLGRKENFKLLLSLKENLRNFIASNSDSEWKRKEIEGITASGSDFNIFIEFEPQYDLISRTELEDLIKEIEKFERKEDKNVFVIQPIEYKGKIFLLWQNKGRVLDCCVDTAIKHLERHQKESVIPYIEFLVDKEYGEKYIEKPYRFKVYTEMNKITGAE